MTLSVYCRILLLCTFLFNWSILLHATKRYICTMEEVYIKDKSFEGKDPIVRGEYERCTFKNVHGTKMDLSECIFTDCSFVGCDLSMAKLQKTSFASVQFRGCKLLGLAFDTCNPFGLSFSFNDCLLNHASFFKARISKTTFIKCQLKEADFTEADLTGVVFDNCDLQGSTFDNTILEKADLRTAFNFSINPVNNRIRKAKFSIAGLAGLLDQFDIEIDN